MTAKQTSAIWAWNTAIFSAQLALGLYRSKAGRPVDLKTAYFHLRCALAEANAMRCSSRIALSLKLLSRIRNFQRRESAHA